MALVYRREDQVGRSAEQLQKNAQWQQDLADMRAAEQRVASFYRNQNDLWLSKDDEEKRRKQLDALRNDSVIRRSSYLQNILGGAEELIEQNTRYRSYDEWGQATGDQTYIGQLQSQLNDLETQINDLQGKNINLSKLGLANLTKNANLNGDNPNDKFDLTSAGLKAIFGRDDDSTEAKLADAKAKKASIEGKLANTYVERPQEIDPTYAFYANRSDEQLANDQATLDKIVNAEVMLASDLSANSRETAIRKEAKANLQIVNQIIADREKEAYDKYYLDKFNDENFDGTYDPTIQDTLYQFVNGHQPIKAEGNTATESALLGTQLELQNAVTYDEMDESERRLFNSIYKNDGRAQALEYLEHLQSDLNFRNRVKEQDMLVREAKDSPVLGSIGSVVFRLASPKVVLDQLIDYAGDGTIDQNAPYNRASYLASSMRNEVTRRIQSESGESAAWVYQMGMSVADNLAQMALSGGKEAAILMLMGSSVFADAVIEGKDAGKTDSEVLFDATVRAGIEVATEKVGLDQVLKVGKGGGWRQLLKAAMAEGAEEGASNLSNLTYDIIKATVNGNENEIEARVNDLMALGFSEGEATSKAIWEKAKDLGLDMLGGAISGFALGGGSAVINITNDKISAFDEKYIKQSVEEVIDLGLSLDSDSEAYQHAKALQSSSNLLAREIKKIAQIKLNDAEATREYSETYKSTKSDFSKLSSDDIVRVSEEAIASANSRIQQSAIAKATFDTLIEKTQQEIKATNATIEHASGEAITQILRLTNAKGMNATVRLTNGEIANLDDVTFENGELGTVYKNAVKGLRRTSDANDYVAGYKMTEGLPAQAYDTLFKTAYRMGSRNANITVDAVKNSDEAHHVFELPNTVIPDSVIQMAINDGANSANRVTEGEMNQVFAMADALGVEVEFVEGLTDESGEYVEGDTDKDTLKIRISKTTTTPAAVTFCHELTHVMQLRSPKTYQLYKDAIIAKLKENPKTYKNMEEDVKRIYGEDYKHIEDEIVAIASENYLIDSAFVASLKENKHLYSRIQYLVITRYNKLGMDKFRAGMLKATAQDIEWFEKLGKLWVDVATEGEKTEAEIEELREELGLKKEEESDWDDEGGQYSYNSLTSKPDMVLTKISATSLSRSEAVSEGIKNIEQHGSVNEEGRNTIYVADIDGEVAIGKNAMKHSLDRRANTNKPAIIKAGEILENAIRINDLTPKMEEASESYPLIGAAIDEETGKISIVEFLINRFTNEVRSIDVVKSVNKKEASTEFAEKSTPRAASSTITIADLLEYVNETFPDVLPESVLRHFGYTSRPDGVIGESALYSRSFEDGLVQEGDRAVFSADRLSYLIDDSGAGSRTDYARKWATSINPTDFINLTIQKEYQDREKFDTVRGEFGETNQTYDYIEGLKKSRLTPFLEVDIDTGQVVGHEGRHRMRALEMAGITNTAVTIEFYKDGYLLKEMNGYGNPLETIDSLIISNQTGTGQTATIQNIIPINQSTEVEVQNAYGENGSSNTFAYSRSFDSSREAAPVFYSQLERVVELYKGDKIGASSLIPYLKGRGIKDEEIKWSGLSTFLEGKKSVSKEEVLQYIKDNQVQVEEKILSGRGIDTNDYDAYFGAKDYITEMALTRVAELGLEDEVWDVVIDEDDTLWRAYGITEDGKDVIDPETGEVIEFATLETEGETRWGEYTLPDGENYREVLYKMPSSNYSNSAMDTHWHERGVVAHARVQDFDDILFIEEIQSDWHNEGQKKGYSDTYEVDTVEKKRAFDEYREKYSSYVDMEDAFIDNAWNDVFLYLLDNYKKQFDGFVDHPTLRLNVQTIFDDLKHNIRNMSATEWDKYVKRLSDSSALTEHISELQSIRDAYLRVKPLKDYADDLFERASRVPDAPFKNGKYVEFVLKDLLRKAAEEGKQYLAWTSGQMQEERWSESYAEGYRIEYDQDIPRFLKKYGKQWGAYLDEVELLPEMTEDEWVDYTGYGRFAPAIKITDAMRESVVYEGQPMFSRSFENTNEVDTELLGRVTDALSQVDVSRVRLSDDVVTKIARRIKWGLASEYPTQDLANNLKKAFAYWQKNRNVDFNALTQIMSEIMMPVVDNMYDYSGDTRRRMLVRNKTFIISEETANQFGGINELNQSMLRYGVAFTTNENFKPADRRVVVDGEVTYVPSNREVLKLADNWFKRNGEEVSGVADDLGLDYKLEDEVAMITAMTDFLRSEKTNARRQAIPDEFKTTFAYNLALKAYEEFVGESRVPQGDVNRRARENVARESRRMLEELRGEYVNQFLNMMAEGEEAIRAEKDRITERAEKAKYFDMLRREMKRFEKLATKKSKSKHFDFDYMKYIGRFGELIDLTSNRQISRTNNILRELASEYKRLAQLDMYQNGYYDPTVENMINEVAELIDGRAIRDLKSQEIKKVFEAVRAFIHIASQNDTFIDLDEAKDINEAAIKTMNDINNAKGVGDSRFSIVADWWKTTSLNPQREFARITDYHDDDPMMLLINKLVKGEVMINQYKMEMSQIFSAMDYRQQTTEEGKKRAKEFRKRYDEMNDNFIEVQLGGKPVRITEAMKLALVLHSTNEDNMRHILWGGLRIPVESLYKRGNYLRAYAKGETIVPTEMEINYLAGELDEFQRWFINRCRYYFETYSKDLINATSLKLEGFARAEVTNYYPIRVADDMTNAKSYDVATGLESSGESIHNGMLMARTKSTLPIYLNSITQDLVRSQNFVSRYAALAIPLRDFQRIYNIKLEDGTNSGTTMQRVINQKWGENALKYIKDMLDDLTNGRAVSTKLADKMLDTVRSKSAQAVLTLNPSVSMKQTASYPTAIAELDYKSVMRALVNPEGNSFFIKRADQALIAKYTPILWSRMQGMSTQEIAELQLDRHKNAIDKSIEKLPILTDWIRKADVMTVGRLWYATQYWVDDHEPNLVKGTDAYYKRVAEKFEDVVLKTQPNYTVMTRPDILRSKNSLVKALMMFKTQPLQNFGILFDSASRYSSKLRQFNEAKGTDFEGTARAELREAGIKLGRSVTSQLLQTAVFTGMTFLASVLLHRLDKYKDKELDEITFASFAEQYMWDYMDSLFGNNVIVDWVADFGIYFVRKFGLGQDVQNYGISVFGIDNLNDMNDTIDKMFTQLKKGDTDKALKYGKTFAEAMAQVFGIPAANVEKLLVGAWEWTMDFAGGKEVTDADVNTSESYWKRIKKAYAKGEDVDALLEDMVDTLGEKEARKGVYKNDSSGTMEWISDMYVHGTDEQRRMIEKWLDEMYAGQDMLANDRIKAFYEYQDEAVPEEYQTTETSSTSSSSSTPTKNDTASTYVEYGQQMDSALTSYLNGSTITSIPVKKGDETCSVQMARLYQNATDKEAVKRFAVEVMGYSPKAINRTANEWAQKDLSIYK